MQLLCVHGVWGQVEWENRIGKYEKMKNEEKLKNPSLVAAEIY